MKQYETTLDSRKRQACQIKPERLCCDVGFEDVGQVLKTQIYHRLLSHVILIVGLLNFIS